MCAVPHILCPKAAVMTVLQEVKAGIDIGALEQDVEAALLLQELAKQLAQKESALSRCVCLAILLGQEQRCFICNTICSSQMHQQLLPMALGLWVCLGLWC